MEVFKRTVVSGQAHVLEEMTPVTGEDGLAL